MKLFTFFNLIQEMKQEQPILSCAGREAVSIDSALVKELLLSYKPNTIGIRQKALNVADYLMKIAEGNYPNDGLERFKEIITTEFLSVQLMEASDLARKEREEYESRCF
jgi:hypothetical protein